MISRLPSPGTPRILVLATLVNTIGNGAYLTTSALFLTRSVGLTPGQVAAGLSLAALAGIVLTTPMGYLADRHGPKRVQVVALLALAACFAALTRVGSLWSFVAVACVVAVGDATVKAASGAMIAGAVPAGQRVRTRAFVRSTNNAGIGLGTLAGAAALLMDSRAGYLAVLLANAATYVAAAMIVSRAGEVPPVRRRPGAPRLESLRDRPFMAFALLDGLVAALYNDLLSLALPLWLVARTHAPTALVSAALLVNTVGCVSLQVWASRGTHTAADAIAVNRRGALIVALSCILFGLTADRPSWLVGALVLAGSVVHVLGELQLASATFAVVFDLPPEGVQGQYQGAYQTGRQIGNMAAPPLLTALVIGVGVPGWIGLAAVFATAGLVCPHIIRWGLRQSRRRHRGASTAGTGTIPATEATAPATQAAMPALTGSRNGPEPH